MTSDAFAPPQAPQRVPDHTTGDLFGMVSRFAVGPHEVEVQTRHWTGSEVYRVDGVDQLHRRNLGWHTDETLQVGRKILGIRGRWYPLLPVSITLDGRPYIEDLFPQLRRMTRTIAVCTWAVMTVLGMSILWDVYRWLGL